MRRVFRIIGLMVAGLSILALGILGLIFSCILFLLAFLGYIVFYPFMKPEERKNYLAGLDYLD